MSDDINPMQAELDGILQDRKKMLAAQLAVEVFENVIVPGIAEVECRDVSADAESAYALEILPKLRVWVQERLVEGYASSEETSSRDRLIRAMADVLVSRFSDARGRWLIFPVAVDGRLVNLQIEQHTRAVSIGPPTKLPGHENRNVRDPNDEWLFAEGRTDEEMANLKMRVKIENPKVMLTDYTCDTCALVRRCTLAYDGYNLDGDCLYEK